MELPSELRGAKNTPGGEARWWWEKQGDCVTCVTILQSIWDGSWCQERALVQIIVPGRSLLVCPEVTGVMTLKGDRIDLAVLLCCLPVDLELMLVKLCREQFAPL